MYRQNSQHNPDPNHQSPINIFSPISNHGKPIRKQQQHICVIFRASAQSVLQNIPKYNHCKYNATRPIGTTRETAFF